MTLSKANILSHHRALNIGAICFFVALFSIGIGMEVTRADNTCGNPPQPKDACGTCGGSITDPNCCPGNGAKGAAPGPSSKGPSSQNSSSSGCATCGAGNPFNPFSGSVTREVPDMALPYSVGAYPIGLTRNLASRWDIWEFISFDTPLGDGGNWRHSYQWSILDYGTNEIGMERIRIIHPNGRVANFAKDATNKTYMTFQACTHERVLPDGTNYYYTFLDGTRHQFSKYMVGTSKLFRMEATIDPYSNRYTYSYASGLLDRVVGPNTNENIKFNYTSLTNSQPPGNIQFTFVDGVATQVLVAGDFSGWTGQAMTVASGSNWSKTISLTNGFWQYKFIVRYAGSNDIWKLDPSNPMFCYDSSTNQNSVAVIDPYKIISSVQLGDGRSVTMSYDWVESMNVINIRLTRVDYGDGTHADYAYYHPSNDLWRRPLLKTADDPHYEGPARSVKYIYQTNNLYSGQVYEEDSLVTTQLLSRLIIDDANSDLRQVQDADGNITSIGFSGGQFTTNAVGYTTRADLYATNGMLWRWVDSMSRTTVYERTLEFGATVVRSNNVLGAERFVYSDTNQPFFLISYVDQAGRTNRYTRDGTNRITTWSYPDGSSESATYNTNAQIVSHTFQNGSFVSNAYDAKGLLAQTIDQNGNSTYYSYDAYMRLTAVSNALGYVTYSYFNWRGLLTNAVYPDGTSEIYEYNRYGQVTSVTDRAGGHTVTQYDDLGRVSAIVNQLGYTNLFTFSTEGRLLTQVSPLGLIVSNGYDGIGRQTREAYSGDGTERSWQYDAVSKTNFIDRTGANTAYTYTPEGWLKSITDPLGRVWSNAYDIVGNRIQIFNPYGNFITNTYDAANRKTSSKDCGGATFSNVYDSSGLLVAEIDANGIVTTNTYDFLRRLTSKKRSGLLLSTNQYNVLGWLVWSQDASGLAKSNTYDVVGRLLRTYLPDNSYVENQYTNTFLVKQIDRAGRATTVQRDVIGRVTNQIDNATNSVTYRYDALGNMTNLIDQVGGTTSFRFDSESRLTARVYADSTTNAYSYDGEGRPASKLDGKSVTTVYRYDKAGNLTNVDYATDADVSLSYDSLNRITKMIDAVGTSVYAYVSDCGKVLSLDGPFANDTISYSYDVGKRLTNISMGSYVVGYAFDDLDRISKIISGSRTNGYSYIANGRLVDLLSLGNGAGADYSYDTLLRLTNLVNKTATGSVLSSFEYQYSDADLRTRVKREDGRTIDYAYDPIGQLIYASGSHSGYTFDYAYDKSGNLTRQNNNGFVLSNAFNAINESTTSVWSGVTAVLGAANITNGTVTVNGTNANLFVDTSFAATNLPVSSGSNIYTAIITDPLGRTATNKVTVQVQNRGYGYDKNGNLTNDTIRVYVWNEADRLTQVIDLATGNTIMTCKYDGMGRRRERITWSNGVGSTNRYVYHNWLVVGIIDGSTNFLETFTHGTDMSGTLGGAGGIGGIVTCTSGSVSRTLHYDGNGNVVNVTDTNCTVIAAIEYGPYGTLLTQTGIYNSRYKFATKEYDDTVGLSYYGLRYYSPSLGKWLSRDPLLVSKKPSYIFSGNDPVSVYDILGAYEGGSCPEPPPVNIDPAPGCKEDCLSWSQRNYDKEKSDLKTWKFTCEVLFALGDLMHCMELWGEKVLIDIIPPPYNGSLCDWAYSKFMKQLDDVKQSIDKYCGGLPCCKKK